MDRDAPAHRVLLDLSTDAVAVHLTAPDDGQPPLRGFLSARPRGREPMLDAAALQEALEARGVSLHDAAREAIDDLALRFNAGTAELDPVMIVEGMAPTGRDGRKEWLVDRPVPLNQLPPPEDWENVDLRERGQERTVVHKGQPLVRIVPALKGLPGRDVLGREIPALGKPPPALRAGKNVKTEEGGLLYVAGADGQVLVRRETVDVEPVIDLANVDFKTRNVHFPGVVRVRGEVLDGFVVEGAHGVFVSGIVGSARVASSDGDVEVRGGLSGHEHGPAHVEAAHHVRIGYANHAEIRAGGDAILTKEALNCAIQAGGRIVVRNRIVGGTATAEQAIEVGAIGSPGGVRTTVVVAPNNWVDADLAHCSMIVRQRVFARSVVRFGPHVHHFEDDVPGPIEILFDPERTEIRWVPRRG